MTRPYFGILQFELLHFCLERCATAFGVKHSKTLLQRWVLIMASIKIMVMWDMMPCNLVESIKVLKIPIYQTTWYHISEDHNLEFNFVSGNHFLLNLLDWVTPGVFGEDY
jgi:hypothetical protein